MRNLGISIQNRAVGLDRAQTISGSSGRAVVFKRKIPFAVLTHINYPLRVGKVIPLLICLIHNSVSPVRRVVSIGRKSGAVRRRRVIVVSYHRRTGDIGVSFSDKAGIAGAGLLGKLQFERTFIGK